MKAANKLKKNQDFRRVYKKKISMGNRLLVIYLLENGLKINRVGFTVSKKVGKSVVRSRVKRLMKESYRLNCHKLYEGYDIVFVAKQGCAEASYFDVESAMIHLLKKMKLMKKNEV